MQAHQLKPPAGAKHSRRRLGRGNASGRGTYAGRGLKGQKARNKVPRYFEGGQTRLFKKLPYTKGFVNRFRVEYSAVNLRDLERFEAGTEVTPELLRQSGILRSLRKPVKLLADGNLTRALTVSVHMASQAAKDKVEAAGGIVVETARRVKAPKKIRVKKDKGKVAKAAAAEKQAEADAAGAKADKSGEKAAEEGGAEETTSGDGS
jgi:large subunit ribosomal protein L15